MSTCSSVHISLPHSLTAATWQPVQGYSEAQTVQSLVVYPRSIEDCQLILEQCRQYGYLICCRGGGYTYGDMILNSDQIILDTTQMSQVLQWDTEAGTITVQPGVTFASIFRKSLLCNWALSSCPGGMDVTIGGAVSNNVHGKDACKNGNFGDQVLHLKLLLSSGEVIEVDRAENAELFRAVIGGMGLLGIIVEVTLQLKKIPSPYVLVTSSHVRNIEESIEVLERSKENSDFSVAWVDAFAKDSRLGRGYVSTGKWLETDKKADVISLRNSLRKPNLLFGLLPAKPTWFIARPFFKPWGIRNVNRLHYQLAKYQISSKKKASIPQLFTDYNFMHNKIPELKHVYRPHGFYEFQPLIPRACGVETVKELFLLCQRHGSESLLCGMKVHKADDYLISYEGAGYSIGVDIQIGGRPKEQIVQFAKEIFAFTKNCGGKIFLAKDEMLDRDTFQNMYPHYKRFIELKRKYDLQGMFSSGMFRRLMST
jgi:decaprenylphospho-beta-D-ribofuranose 2-oxidase